jgi:hypothetical protein
VSPTNPTNWGAGSLGGDASPFDDVLVQSGVLFYSSGGGAVTLSANQCVGARLIVPRSGTLRDLSVFIEQSSGNIEAGILNVAATTRTRLYTTGSIPSPGTNWRTLGDPQLAVNRGDHLDVYLGVNNAVARFPISVVAADPIMPLLPSGFFPAPLGGQPALAWSANVFPMGATLAEASMISSDAFVPLFMRIV